MNVKRFLSPTDLKQLRQALGQMDGESCIVAGCTDFLARRNGRDWRMNTIINVADVVELRQISHIPDGISIGAACTHAQIAAHPEVQRQFPALADACASLGSPQVRNRGTIGGNLANASPAGDMLPALLALDAKAVVLDSIDGERTIPVDALVTTQGRTVLQPGQALVRIELPDREEVTAFRKLGERTHVTIAKLSVAVAFRLSGRNIAAPRVAMGAVARRAFLSAAGAAALKGRPLTEETFALFSKTLSQEIAQAIPTRESMPYKRAAVRGVTDDLYQMLSARAEKKQRSFLDGE